MLFVKKIGATWQNKKYISLLVTIIIGILVTGCKADSLVNTPEEQKPIESIESSKNPEPPQSTESTKNPEPTIESESEELKDPEVIIDIPKYSGLTYAVINNNIPYFSESEKNNINSFEIYSELDEKGRCGVAFANICKETMPEGERGPIGQIRPSGWHTVKYNDLIDGNYLYNRCHLIGWQLAGENDNEKNLITGTRYLNVSGMLPFEEDIAGYVKSSGNHVIYRVTPKFDGDNLVADGVLMEAWSVEDNGIGICFNVFCYNVQPGIEIDYTTGESRIGEESVEIKEDGPLLNESIKYVLNTNTKKFHYPSCKSVEDISEKNRWDTDKTRDEITEAGYKPCGRCNP